MLQTCFLLFAALKETYSENPEALDEAMAMVASDLHCALHTGVPVVVNGLQLRLRFCVCSVKGDWPFLIEAAHLERHFRRAPKRGESSLASPGVCHLCLGGVSGISYTDFSTSPDWERTMDSAAAQVPWHSVSPWHSLPAIKDFRPFTFRPDLFHGFHLGHGRYFLSSALVVLQQLEEGDGVETRFQQLSRKWLQYCRSVRVPWQNVYPFTFFGFFCLSACDWNIVCYRCCPCMTCQERPYLQKISRESLGFMSHLDWPEGKWQKGSTTTLLMAPCLQILFTQHLVVWNLNVLHNLPIA